MAWTDPAKLPPRRCGQHGFSCLEGELTKLGEVSGVDVGWIIDLIYWHWKSGGNSSKSMGATATDHAALTPATAELTPAEADVIFQRALNGKLDSSDAARFTAHMLMEMARMSIDDGLVMQLHPGSLRNHNELVFNKFGLDKGAESATK